MGCPLRRTSIEGPVQLSLKAGVLGVIARTFERIALYISQIVMHVHDVCGMGACLAYCRTVGGAGLAGAASAQ